MSTRRPTSPERPMAAAQRSLRKSTSAEGLTVTAYGLTVRVPAWVTNLATFRRWVKSGAVPEKTRVSYLAGDTCVDVSMEQFFSHNQVKQEFGRVLGQMVRDERLGRYIPDGMLVTNVAADLSNEPDGCFVSREGLRAGRVRLTSGGQRGNVELVGTPDMVLEIVSDSSVEKDTVTLPKLYWRAGVAEYWLVDARGERADFQILRRTAKGYATSPKRTIWHKSNVFGRSFRLTRGADELGDPEFTLDAR